MILYHFHYLRSMLQKNGDVDEDVSHRNKVGWLMWRQVSSVLYGTRLPQNLKGKFYRTMIRPTMLYGGECWPTKRQTCPTTKCGRDVYVPVDLWPTRRDQV
jgi:hypothetical protein